MHLNFLVFGNNKRMRNTKFLPAEYIPHLHRVNLKAQVSTPRSYR